jgi:protein-S-isoprenylcysteine O-methyltransferase Ste14
VVSGPYSHTRNPMAMAGLAQGAAVGLLLGSYGVLAYCLCGGILWNTIIRPLEEADLSQRFGADYERYRSHVRCWRWRLVAFDQRAAP